MIRSAYGYKTLTGLKFGKWTIMGDGVIKNKNRIVPVICECGAKKEVYFQTIVQGKSLSCGCTANEQSSIRLLKNPISLRLPEGEASKNALLSSYKGKARERGLMWELTTEDFFMLTNSNCFYCDSKPSNVKKNKYKTGDYIYNGIDRIDNTIGYTLNNVVACCKKCNIAKNEMSLDEFKKLITNIYNKLVK